MPYLQKLATKAKSRSAIIYRLSFSVPPNILRLLANGLVIGKIMAAAPAAIPFKLAFDDRAANLATEKINRAIKSVARTITKTSLKDMVSTKCVLEKADTEGEIKYIPFIAYLDAPRDPRGVKRCAIIH